VSYPTRRIPSKMGAPITAFRQSVPFVVGTGISAASPHSDAIVARACMNWQGVHFDGVHVGGTKRNKWTIFTTFGRSPHHGGLNFTMTVSKNRCWFGKAMTPSQLNV